MRMTKTLQKRAMLIERLRNAAAEPGCDYLEIRYEDTLRTDFQFLGKRLDELNEGRQSGLAIRALVDGCWGFVTFNDIEGLEQGVHNAIRSAQIAASFAKGKSMLAPVDPIERTIQADAINDPTTIPIEKKLALFSAYNDRVLAGDGITSSSVYYFDTLSHIIFANSEGTFIDRERLDLACGIRPIASGNGDTRSGTVSAGSTNDYNVVIGLEEEIDRSIEEATGKLRAPVIGAGTYTVICDPTLAGVFVHEAFGHLSEGDNLADDPRMQEVLTLGRRFGGDYLNIYDSGLDVGLRGHVPVDDEGVPGRHTDLIKNGVLVGRLHSRETAGKLGEAATGNCRALSYRFPPIPRMRNTCIAAGPHGKLSDLLRGVKQGVYAVGAAGGQTNGELFTFTARDAFMIRDGVIGERVKDVTISGNVFETLGRIDAVGSDHAVHDSAGGCGKGGQMPLPVSHGSPHIRIAECVIGGA